ncbi:SAV_2336 N-terminal domain-related protein [Streptomyces sp. NPDC057939]|uniref:SAV_2336 N-terminal domain-related protein n=1 Tax=Streptomyces sp. NPDC057939 TaxID=3346284 RepID=UPI0036E618E3
MPAAVPPPPFDPEVRTLAVLLRAAGLDPSAEELADALWLAARTRRPARSGPDAEAPNPTERPGPTPGPGTPDGTAPPAPEPPEPVPPEPEVEDPVGLYADGPGVPSDTAVDTEVPVGDAVPVRVPGAAALPRILDIQRALRALQRHRPPGRPTRTVLDENATAEASARALGLVIPVFRPESRREATVRLVMDASPSMAVWQEMFEELRTVCERLGAFRDVQVHRLHRLADGTPAVGRGPAPGVGLRSGDQLRDPTGRALTMIVSDCAGPLWREGEAQRLLYRWAQCTPCVVVQPLPQRLWGRSWLPTERGVLERTEDGAGGPGGGRLRFRRDRPPRPGRPGGGLTVPVLPPNATALGAWARLVAGLGTGPVPAEVGRVQARHPAAPVPLPRAARPPRELVSRFRASAAPGAVQLAVYLSAAPLTLPVMRLVQRTMLPDSEPSDLAEVLLSGLLRRTGEVPGQWYEFVPGVQDVLLGPLGRDEAALVLKHCSEYVLAHFGRGVRNFPALAVSQLTGVASAPSDPGPARAPGGQLPQAFAHVSARVVRRYLPGPPEPPEEEPPADGTAPAGPPPAGRARAVRAARDRLADGDARAPYEAVALLRRAVALPAGPQDPPEEAEAALTAALLVLWAAQRDPELLDEAQRAVTGLHTPTARSLLGRVLYERALAGGGDAELLAAADREFAAAGAATTDPGLRRDCAVRRSRTLIRLAALRNDPAPLREARAALEALTAPNGPGEGPEPGPFGERRGGGGVGGTGEVDGSGGVGGVGGKGGTGADPHGEDVGPGEEGRGGGVGQADGAGGTGGRDSDSDSGSGPDPDAGSGEVGRTGEEAGRAVDAGGSGEGDADPGLRLALGRVLLALLPRTPDAAARTALAEEAAAVLTAVLATLAGAASRTDADPEAADPDTADPDAVDPTGTAPDGVGPPARVRVELATALRYLPGRLEEAARQLVRALDETAGDPELRLAGLLCLARVHRARYARDADPVALEAAAEAYGRARRLSPRDGEAFAELLPEWGDVLLERARTPDGQRFVSAAVRVLRESRSAVPQSDPGAAHRLLRLAAGLRLRHAYEGDLVDLREAEHLLELAARQGHGPLERARAWREHGDVQQEIHAHTRTVDRLDRAADSYRRAWRAALEADREERAETALQLAARVQELRGEVLERLARPRAALDAYRAALELWQRVDARHPAAPTPGTAQPPDPGEPNPPEPPHGPGPGGPPTPAAGSGVPNPSGPSGGTPASAAGSGEPNRSDAPRGPGPAAGSGHPDPSDASGGSGPGGAPAPAAGSGGPNSSAGDGPYEAPYAAGHGSGPAPGAGPGPGQVAGHGAVADFGRDTVPGTARDAGHGPARDFGREIDRDTGRGAGRDAGHGAVPDFGPGVARTPRQDPGRGAAPGPDGGRASDPDPGVARDSGRTAGHDAGPDGGPGVGPTPGQDPGGGAAPDRGRKPGPDGGRTSDPDPGVAYDSGRTAGHDAEPGRGPGVGPAPAQGPGRGPAPGAGREAGPDGGRAAADPDPGRGITGRTSGHGAPPDPGRASAPGAPYEPGQGSGVRDGGHGAVPDSVPGAGSGAADGGRAGPRTDPPAARQDPPHDARRDPRHDGPHAHPHEGSADGPDAGRPGDRRRALRARIRDLEAGL